MADAMKMAHSDAPLSYDWIDALNAYPEQTAVDDFKINADRMEARILARLAAQGMRYT